MIRHTVLARLADGSAAPWAGVMESLRALVNELDGAVSMTWGPNVSPETGMDQGFSDAFVVDFTDEQARDAYLADPRHVALGEQIVSLVEGGGVSGLIVVDLHCR